MPNKVSAMEWLRIAYHDLKSAQILLDANHLEINKSNVEL